MTATSLTSAATAEEQPQGYNPWMSILSQGPVTSTTMASPLQNLLHKVPCAVIEHAPIAVPGAPAPDFDLLGSDGRRVTLADFRGAPLVLRFTRAVGSPSGTFFCPMCSAGVDDLVTTHSEFDKRGIQLAVVMPTEPEAAEAVIEARNLPYPMYTDPEWKSFAAYGAGHLIGAPKAAWAIIDGDGIVQWIWRLGGEGEDNGHVLRASDVLEVADDLFGAPPA